jgi:hypothetical protein
MSIVVSCPECGKALKVKDEWAGRTAKCPGCEAKVSIPAAAAAVASAAAPAPRASTGGTRYDPMAAAAAAAQRKKAAGSFETPWGLIIGGAAVLLIAIGIGAFLMGPKKVWNEWEKIGEKAHDDVIDVVSRGLQGYLADTGIYDPGKSHATPEAREVMFYRPSWKMSMPEAVDFEGGSTEGAFLGKYHPQSGEVEVDVDINSLATGRGSARKVPKIHVTGRVKNGAATVEVNGKKVQ